MNALRHTIAPLSGGSRFFSQVVVSGSHMASIAMLQRGQAAVAAIDCATYGLALRHAPHTVAGVRVLQTTAPAPGLPLIASRRLTDAQAQDLQDVVLTLPVIAAPALQIVSIDRFHAIGLPDYEPIRAQARFAAGQGYPELV
jgi:ABC-type phosphate/phosphonate transport system substrate-binding protein